MSLHTDGPDAPREGRWVAWGVGLMRVEAVVPQVTGGGTCSRRRGNSRRAGPRRMREPKNGVSNDEIREAHEN